MATYKEIHGVNLPELVSDPSIGGPIDIWYNTTSGKFKVIANLTSGTWASGGNMGTARYFLAGAGTQTAGLAFGGATPGGDETEEYDGSAWTAGGFLNQGRYGLAGAGTQTAGLAIGNTTETEEYNGSVWTVGGNLNISRRKFAAAGTQTAGLGFAGLSDDEFDPNDSTFLSNTTEEYDGSTWTAGGNLSTKREYIAGAGTQTAGLGFGGQIDSFTYVVTNATEEYDGTSWTAGGNLGSVRYEHAGAGTQTAGLSFGGETKNPYNTPDAATEQYDGTSWTAGGNMNTSRYILAGAGTQSSGLAFGGKDTNYNDSNKTEEYEGPGAYIRTLTSSI